MLDSLPPNTHPMTQFSMAVMALQTESIFAAAYRKGISKKDYWDPMYEDVMNLIARLPRVAAYIYRKNYKKNVHIEPDPKLEVAPSPPPDREQPGVGATEHREPEQRTIERTRAPRGCRHTLAEARLPTQRRQQQEQ